MTSRQLNGTSLPALGLLAAAACGLAAAPARAQLPQAPAQRQNPVPGPESEAPATAPSPGEPGFTTQLFASSRSSLLGDAYGLRPFLNRFGVSLGLQETSEVFGNATGGVHRGAAYDGLTLMSVGLDTERAFGLPGGTLNISAFQIHGRNLATDNLLNLNTNSGIQATRSTRLWEAWYQQAFLNGRVDLKIGQQSLDQEYIGSAGAGLFINTMMGWPVVPSFDLYAGGPAYPLSSLGVRLRGRISDQVTALVGVYDDNPPGGPFYDDSQVRGGSQSGTAFNTRTGALVIGELQYFLNQPVEGQVVTVGGRPGLSGAYKIGAWYDTAKFYDQRIDTTGLSLADPASSGLPRFRRKNWSIYGVADQTVWQPNPDEPLSVGVFTRLMGAPGDRNLVSLGINAGVTVRAPFKGRDNDSFGIGYGLAGVGRSASLLDKDTALQSGTLASARSSESFVEVTYQYSVAPWLLVQPDFQYIFLPAGGIANPNNPAKRIGNEAIFGVRTNITF